VLTDGRLFSVPMAPERAMTLAFDIDLAERTDAFMARFGRLQDTLADKLLPVLLDAMAGRANPHSQGSLGWRWLSPNPSVAPPALYPN
jgi:hypothetical protein